MEEKHTIFRPMRPDEREEVCRLAVKVFSEFVAPHYSREGVEEFLDFARPEAMARRCREGGFVMVAEHGGRIIGMIEVLSPGQISLLYTDAAFQRRGVARELIGLSIDICQKRDPGLAEMTVDSAPNAVEAYRRLGFVPLGPEEIKNGVRFVPMRLEAGGFVTKDEEGGPP